MFYKNKKKSLFFIIITICILYGIFVVSAAPPAGGYDPGETLDPDCLPTDTDCTIADTSYSFSLPIVESDGTVTLSPATALTNGYLKWNDWVIFNAKEDGLGEGDATEYLRGDKVWVTLDTSAVSENGNLYWTNDRFDTRLAAATSLPLLQSIGTITSGVWNGSQITDAYISNSITASNYIPLSQRGVPSGVATLGSDGKVPTAQLTSFVLSDTFVVDSEVEMLALDAAEIGDLAVRTDESKTYILTTNDPSNVANWQQILTPLDSVLSVNGLTGAVTLSTTEISEGTNLYYTDSRVDDYINTLKGAVSGIASLGADGKIPSSQIGDITINETYVVADITEMLAIVAPQKGDIAVVTDDNDTYILQDDSDPTLIASWVALPSSVSVASVNGFTGSVTLTTTDITEGSNLYYTDSRVRSALSVSGPLSFNSGTGLFSISEATAVTNGYLSAVDWGTFNEKQDALTFGNITAGGNPEITITGGTGAIIGVGVDISIPDADALTRGLITTGAQTFAGLKIFTDGIGVGDDAPSELFSVGAGGLFQITDAGDISKIKNISYTWPGVQGSSNTVLVNDGAGNLSWSDYGIASLNGITESEQTFAVGSTGTDFGISSSGSVHTFNLPNASSSARGVVTTGTQTFAGAKTFSTTPIFSALTLGSVPFVSTNGQIAEDNENFYWDEVNNRLIIGAGSVGGGTTLQNTIAHFGASLDDFAQVNIQNRSSGTSASSDLVLTSDNGDNTSYYVDLGINSSTYINPSYTIGGANDAYLYAQSKKLTVGTANATDGHLVFHTGGTLAANERMRILASGNIGIGTTTPGSKLDITTASLGTTQTATSGLALVNTTAAAAGAQQISPALRFSGYGWKTTATAASQAVDFQNYLLPVQGTTNPTATLLWRSQVNGGGYTDRMALTSGGSLGIGTTTPSYLTHLYYNSATPNGLYIQNDEAFSGTSNAFISIRNGQSPSASSTDWNINTYRWNNSNDYLKSSSFYYTAGYTPGFQSRHIFQLGTGTTDNNSYFSVLKQGTPGTSIELFRVNAAGSVGIGASSPSYRLSVSNTSTAGIVASMANSDGTCTLDPGDVSGWSCPSDERLKKNINPIGSVLESIHQLETVEYQLISESNNAEMTVGLLAQQVDQVFPRLVTEQLDGTLALNYGGLTPYLVKAVQEIDLKIVHLESLTPGTAEADNFFTALKTWLGDITNGIERIYADVFESQQVQTQQLCIGSTCLNESQVQQLLQVIGSSSGEISPNPEVTSDPDPESETVSETEIPTDVPVDPEISAEPEEVPQPAEESVTLPEENIPEPEVNNNSEVPSEI